jgi:hypothetical protein
MTKGLQAGVGWCSCLPLSHRQARDVPPRLPLPLQASLVEQIARLVDAGTLTGVADVRDESDRDGVRVVVEVKRGGTCHKSGHKPAGWLALCCLSSSPGCCANVCAAQRLGRVVAQACAVTSVLRPPASQPW